MSNLKRKVHPELIEFIDKRMPPDLFPLELHSPRRLMVEVMKSLVGIQEEGLNNQGTAIRLLQNTVGRAEGEPWCLSTIQSALVYVEYVLDLKCPLPATEHCMTFYQGAKNLKMIDLSYAQVGDIVIWNYRGTSNGHCGVITKVGDMHETIEGNTSAAHTVERDGEGVFCKLRNPKGNDFMSVKAYVKPRFLEIRDDG